jgi:hypothetical protein
MSPNGSLARRSRGGALADAAICFLAIAAGCGGGGGGGSGGTSGGGHGGLGGGGGGAGGAGTGGGGAGGGAPSQSLNPSDDTFMNDRHPDNNNGASPSIFTGVDGVGGVMRGLVQFAIPGALQGATVTGVRLSMTVQALGNGTAGPGATLSLQAVSEAWVQGNGIGDAMATYTVGQACSDTVTGATWNQPSCASGTTATWSTPGGTVAATVSGQANSTGVALEAPVVWDSAAAGNAGMISDVQSWIDTPSGNHGWRIAAGDETTHMAAQRFYATEAGGATVPTLTITYTP